MIAVLSRRAVAPLMLVALVGLAHGASGWGASASAHRSPARAETYRAHEATPVVLGGESLLLHVGDVAPHAAHALSPVELRSARATRLGRRLLRPSARRFDAETLRFCPLRLGGANSELDPPLDPATSTI